MKNKLILSTDNNEDVRNYFKALSPGDEGSVRIQYKLDRCTDSECVLSVKDVEVMDDDYEETEATEEEDALDDLDEELNEDEIPGFTSALLDYEEEN